MAVGIWRAFTYLCSNQDGWHQALSWDCSLQ